VGLGVRTTGALVISLPYDDPVSGNDHGAHHRIRWSTSSPTRRMKQRAAHESLVDRGVGYHFS
jgi:hypothetical protein